MLVDHEGGRVHRLPPPFTRFPPAATIGRTGDPALAGRVARAMARELRAAGFDSGLTPVLDCSTDPGQRGRRRPGVRGRPRDGRRLRHRVHPGRPRGGPDPGGQALPRPRPDVRSTPTSPSRRSTSGLDELERTELRAVPPRARRGCPAVMVNHVRYPALDAEWPASLSAPVVGGLLRGRLDFDGLVLSDDLEMAAVRSQWGVGVAATRFLAAGGDLALICRVAGDPRRGGGGRRARARVRRGARRAAAASGARAPGRAPAVGRADAAPARRRASSAAPSTESSRTRSSPAPAPSRPTLAGSRRPLHPDTATVGGHPRATRPEARQVATTDRDRGYATSSGAAIFFAA